MISLYDLLKASNGQLFGEPAAQLFDDFCLEVEHAAENRLFIALKSEMGDTHQYIEQAIARGVSGVLCQVPPTCNTEGVSVLLVRNTVNALLAWSQYILGKFGTKVIGVSGSAGKSVTVDAVSRVLAKHFPVYTGWQDEPGSLGVPLAMAHLKPSHKFAVLKLGTNFPGEMAQVVQAVQPEVGVVTRIGGVFNDNFETLEQLVKEKSILVDMLSPNGLAVLNYDDDLVRSMASRTRAQVRTIGMSTGFGPDMIAYNVTVQPDGTRFDLRFGSERYVGQRVPLYGKYHLYAVMTALIIGAHYDIPLQESLQTLHELQALPGRMNPLLGLNGSLLVDDTYGANPESTMAALEWVESFKKSTGGRVFFIFGDMENLGKKSQISHRQVGRRAAELVDFFITQGPEAAAAARAALDHGMDASRIHTTYAAHDTVNAILHEYDLGSNDIVLIKGGPSSRLEQVTKQLLSHSEDAHHLVRQTLTVERVPVVHPTRLTWVEIDSNALAQNVRILKNHIGADVTLMAVVKADAYGHGAVVAAQTALLNGAECIGVSSLQEALELREAGIDAPILTMNYTPSYVVRQAIQQDITVTVYDLSVARAYDRIARELNKKLRVHLKIDTGMGRLGVLAADALALARHLNQMSYLTVEGIYTHFSCAGEDVDYTREQLKTFKEVVRLLQSSTGMKFKYTHAANSAGTLAHPEAHFNMVRVGVALYGLQPTVQTPLPEGCQAVMTWKTVVAQVKTLPAGHPVGYGNTYVTSGDETIAILPVGYADGFRRAPQNWGKVLVHGQYAPVIGRVSMEKTIINVTHIPNVTIGDEVVLLGRQREAVITAEDVAALLGTINYEVTCAVLPRVPRR
ncbi:MAG: alanine racemase [Anaerolineae bacterium]